MPTSPSDSGDVYDLPADAVREVKAMPLLENKESIQCCRECAPESGELAQLDHVGGTLLCPNCGHVYEDVSEGGEA